MFETPHTFTTAYLTLTAVLVVLVLFEKHLVKVEEKIKEKLRKKG